MSIEKEELLSLKHGELLSVTSDKLPTFTQETTSSFTEDESSSLTLSSETQGLPSLQNEEFLTSTQEKLPTLTEEVLPSLTQEELYSLTMEGLPVLKLEELHSLSNEKLRSIPVPQEELPSLTQEELPLIEKNEFPQESVPSAGEVLVVTASTTSEDLATFSTPEEKKTPSSAIVGVKSTPITGTGSPTRAWSKGRANFLTTPNSSSSHISSKRDFVSPSGGIGLSELSKQLRILQATNEAQRVENDRLERQLRILADMQGISVAEIRNALQQACESEAHGELQHRVASLRAQLEAATLAKKDSAAVDALKHQVATLQLRVAEYEEVDEKQQQEIKSLYGQVLAEKQNNSNLVGKLSEAEGKVEQFEIKLQQTEAKLEHTEVCLKSTEEKLKGVEDKARETEAKAEEAIEKAKISEAASIALSASLAAAKASAATSAAALVAAATKTETSVESVSSVQEEITEPPSPTAEHIADRAALAALRNENKLLLEKFRVILEKQSQDFAAQSSAPIDDVEAAAESESPAPLTPEHVADRKALTALQRENTFLLEKSALLEQQLQQLEETLKMRTAQWKARFQVQDNQIQDMELQFQSVYAAFTLIDSETKEQRQAYDALKSNLDTADHQVANHVSKIEVGTATEQFIVMANPDPNKKDMLIKTPVAPRGLLALDAKDFFTNGERIIKGSLLIKTKVNPLGRKKWMLKTAILYAYDGSFQLDIGGKQGGEESYTLHKNHSQIEYYKKQPYGFVIQVNVLDQSKRSVRIYAAAEDKVSYRKWLTALAVAVSGLAILRNDSVLPIEPPGDDSVPAAGREGKTVQDTRNESSTDVSQLQLIDEEADDLELALEISKMENYAAEASPNSFNEHNNGYDDTNEKYFYHTNMDESTSAAAYYESPVMSNGNGVGKNHGDNDRIHL